jgi:hypothetical protein
MSRRVRNIRWVIALSVVTALTVSTRAAENWASPAALGDVIVSFNTVSFNTVVRVYGNEGTPKGADLQVAGTSGGIAFDDSLTLFVTNTNNTVHQLVKLSPNDPHDPTGTPQATQANPESIVFAGDGTYYVASRLSSAQALIRRFSGTTATDFTVTVGSGPCIGIDLDANQTILYIVDGATNPTPRKIRTLDVSTTNTQGTQGALPTDLVGNQGSACGIRALPPERHSWSSPASGPTNGGFLVADKDRIQRVSSTGLFVAQYNTGTNTTSDNNWRDVDLDPNTFDFWGLDAGEKQVAKFRIASPPNALPGGSISTAPDVPRGLTLNGALRAAQTIRILTNITADTATFLQDAPTFQHEFQVKVPEAASLAVQAVEARSDGNPAAGEPATPSGNVEGICPASLDLDCRIDEFFQAAAADDYSRNRAVFYMLTELTTFASPNPEVQISVLFAGSNPGSGAACVPNGPTQPAFALLWDPFPHIDPSLASGYSVFPYDITVLVFSDEVGTVGRTGNHYVVANRTDTLYNAEMVKPAPNSTQQLGSTLQVAVAVRDPATNCSVVPGLVGTLALSISDLTAKTLVADSEDVSGTNVITSGLTFVQNAGQYRANVTLTSTPSGPFVAGNVYRVCVNAKTNAGFLTDPNDRAIGEVCQQFTAVAGKGKQ